MTNMESIKKKMVGSVLDSMDVAAVRIPPTTWGGDLMEGNPRDPLHLRVRELWV